MLYVWDLGLLFDHCRVTETILADGRWVPARPMDFAGPVNIWYRARAAWQVFRGRADAFVWPGQPRPN